MTNSDSPKAVQKKPHLGRSAIYILLIGLVLGGIGGYILGNYKPCPLIDWGHRLYAVRDERAAAIVTAILARNELGPRWAFDASPTHQVVLNDQRTVIA